MRSAAGDAKPARQHLGVAALGLALSGSLVLFGILGIRTAIPASNAETRIVVDAKLYPWSTLGRVNTGGQGHCTGVLISERHVLTRAQCLYNATEGRWWSPTELHFVAGYQRDRYRLHSAVRRIHVAPGYKGGQALLANLGHDWAILWLFQPIGAEAGWIALQGRDRGTLARLNRGEAFVVDAGYRTDHPHVITLKPDCSFGTFRHGTATLRRLCRWSPTDRGLAKLIFVRGELRVLMPETMPREIAGQDLAATRSITSLPQPLQRQSSASLLRLLQQAGFTTDRAVAQEAKPSTTADGRGAPATDP